MKRFIVIISAFFCLSMAQDIAGSWTLTAVDVWYYNFARVNHLTDDPAYGDYQGSTPLYVNDTYGLGASLPLAWLPPGYMFLGVPNGPFGEAGLIANGVSLNVNLETDGTGTIPSGSTYPDISLDPETCITSGSVQPVTDIVEYSSHADAGVTLPLTDIVGKPSGNRYAGTESGTMSLTQSVIFSFFPETAVNDYSPIPLYFGDGTPGTSFTPDANGFPTIGTTGGYIKTSGFDGSIGDDGPLSGGDNVDPELGLYWHSIDGASAETGFGDDLDVDEDGDGTPYDRVFGLPAISATRVDPGFAYSMGFGGTVDYSTGQVTGFDHLVAGDIQAPLQGLIYDGCLDTVADGVYAGCLDQVEDGVEAQCDAADLDGDGVGTPVEAVTGLCAGASQTPEFAGACTYYGPAAAVTATCLQLGFDQETCDAAGAQGLGGVEAYCQYLSGGYDCATAGIDPCAVLTDITFATGLCGTLAAALTTSETCDEWAASFDDDFLNEQAVGVIGATCSDYAYVLLTEAELDGFAMGSPDTSYMSCSDFSAYLIGAYTEVTTTDDYEDLTLANTVYVMNPDPTYATWSQFVTFNAYAYSLTGNPALLVDDSDHDLDFENDFTFVSLATGLPCDPTSGDPYCAPYSANGGRLVFAYQPTCVPVIEAIEVQTEFIGIADGECSNDGDANSDGSVTVLDIVMIVQHVLGSAPLTDAEACQADINSDGSVTVLDIVVIVNQILNGRGEAATSAEFIRVGDALEMNADGIVDAVQITLSHGDDFSIELTDNALVAEYATENNQTTLIIVSPEDKEIFTANGEYVIEEVAAANTNGYIETSMPVSFNLSEAYPNPFNPSTSLDIALANEGSVSIVAYNVMGQMVGTLHEGNMSAGSHTITWDASSLASGMYIIKAEVAGNIVSKKVMLLK